MAKQEWLPKQRDWAQQHRNVLAYFLGVVGILGSLVGLSMLPEMVSVNPEAANAVARPRALMVGLHFGIIAVFTALFWRRPREILYLAGAVFGVVMLFFMLYTNLGV